MPDDFNAIRWFIDVARADLIVIDPIMAFLGQGIWANNDQRIRRDFTELSRLAAEYDCAILMIRHLIKTGSWKAIYRGGGSIGMIGACRTGLMAGIHPDDPSLRVLTMTKTNVGSPGKSLAFQLVEGEADGVGRVEWLGRADLTATDLWGQAYGVLKHYVLSRSLAVAAHSDAATRSHPQLAPAVKRSQIATFADHFLVRHILECACAINEGHAAIRVASL